MKTLFFKKAWPHLVVIVLFLLIPIIYFSPVIDGKVLQQYDLTHSIGMAQELKEYHEKTGEYAQWTNSMFSGMPAIHVGPYGKNKTIFDHLRVWFRLGMPSIHPMASVFIYLIGFYILLISLGASPWLSLIGAFAFAFSTYNFNIIAVGHITKTYAIGFMAFVVAGIILTFRKKYLLGGLITTLGLGLEISSSHMQITYYLFLLVLVIIIVRFIWALVKKEYQTFIKASLILLVAAILAVIPNITNLWSDLAISEQSTRGKSELTINKNPDEKHSSGLDKDYALDWSYGPAETFSLMIPNVKGGGTKAIGESKVALKNVDDRFKDAVKNQNHYWGEKISTAGPVYAGAIIVFLFILGLFIIEGPIKWWILAATVLSIFLAWGKHFIGFTNLFFDYFPFYNKFRTVEMILVIASLCIPLLALLTLKTVVEDPSLFKKKKKQFYIAFGLTGGLSLLFFLFPGIFNYFSQYELDAFGTQRSQNPQYAGQINMFLDNLKAARISIFRADAIRTLIFISISFGLIWAYATKKVKLNFFLLTIGFLILVDMWGVDKRYLNNDNFITQRKNKNLFAKSPADEIILQDPDSFYRVLNISTSTFQEVNTSYYHKSIGGYHGAKIRRYQDMIDFYISDNIRSIQNVLQSQPTLEKIDSVLAGLSVINMLNTKYIIYNPDAPPIQNKYNFGNAWFVENIKWVNSADEEILALKSIDPLKTAVINTRFENYLKNFKHSAENSGSITLDSYKPDQTIYSVTVKKDQLAVFSEIYYEGGWKAFIDGEPANLVRADYILKALVIPEGTHTVEFKFEFDQFKTVKSISFAGSILVALLIISTIVYYINQERKKQVKNGDA